MSVAQQEQLANIFGTNRMRRAEEVSSFPVYSADFEDMTAAEFAAMLLRQHVREAQEDLVVPESSFGRARIRHI